jgi:hypothetical protein
MAKPAKARPEATDDSLETVYEELEKLLKRHAPPFKTTTVSGARQKKSFQLIVPKPVSIPGAYGGKPVDLMMAAAILQKGYVGFYLMYIYTDQSGKKKLSPALLKLLKGKTCFHVKKLDDGLREDIEAALELSTKCYKERGWL